MSFDRVLDDVRDYYDARLAEHGPTARGVDWNSIESQAVRFDQLARILDPGGTSTLLDYGCGYGAMLNHLRRGGWQGDFTGFDISDSMIATARSLHPDDGEFVSDLARDRTFDYVIASGVFNVRLANEVGAWAEYVNATLAEIDHRAVRGWAVNMLTSYSDPHMMSKRLYYADPRIYFDHCVTSFSRNVAVLHDYGLYEFTLLVRR